MAEKQEYKLELEKGQRIENVNLRLADNGYIVDVGLIKPAMRNTQNQWSNKTFVYDIGEEEDALDMLKECFRMKVRQK